MKNLFLFMMCIFIIALNVGCQTNKTKAAEGAVIGGVLGAAAGGIIGHQSHHGAEGAGIGAAVGAITGAIVGSQIEKTGQSTPAAPATQNTNPNQMSIQQIVDLTKQGIHEDVIIDKIRLSNSRFTLNSNDIDYLKQQGVSQKVIDAIQQGT
jgi:uncharacterized protein YcfJ